MKRNSKCKSSCDLNLKVATKIMKNQLKFKRIREFKFDEKTYKIVWKNKKFKEGAKIRHHRAETEAPSENQPEMRISPNAWLGGELSLLQTLIDETVHCYPALWELDNNFVDKFSDQLGEFLFSIGFRLQKKNEDTNKD